MMPISTKLALLVFVLPLSSLIISDIVVFLFFGVFYIEAIAIFTSNWVFLLVWERLRESLSKKMVYLNENFIFDLYDELKVCDDNNAYFVPYFEVSTKKIKEIRVDLERYSKFLMIDLFPKKLFSRIDQFISGSESLINNTKTVMELGKDKLDAEFSQLSYLYYLGFDVSGIDVSKHTINKKVAELIKAERSQLVHDMAKLLNNLIDIRKEIILELEDFLKANNLQLKQELYM